MEASGETRASREGGMEKGKWDVQGDPRTGRGKTKGGEECKGEQRSEPPHLAAGRYGLDTLHLTAFARPEARGVARQVCYFEGTHWTWWPAHRCVLAPNALPAGPAVSCSWWAGGGRMPWEHQPFPVVSKERISRLRTGGGK